MNSRNISALAQNQKGFTIVELLIVVVVIAILAAITIVSYNGITARANSSAALSMASAIQKKSEIFASDGPTGTYPKALTDLTGGSAGTTNIIGVLPAQATNATRSWYVGSATAAVTTDGAAPTSTNGKSAIQFRVCGNIGTATAPGSIAAMTNVVGMIINYYDFQAATNKPITLGNTTTGGNPNNQCLASTT